MRSLFHFPFPAQPPSQQPSPTATISLQPEMCYRPHPAPMHRQRRSPALLSAACPLPGPALTGPWPTVTRSQGACHAAPPSLPRAAARPHRAPSPEYRPAAPAPIGLASSASRPSRAVARIASTPLRAAIRIPLCRHRADSALIAPPSRPSCAAAVLHVLRFAVRIAPTVRRRPRHPPHLSPRVAAAPGPWLARTAPYASLFRRMREKGPLPGNIRPKCMLFEIKMATSSPHASIPGRNRAIRDTWRANLAAKGPFSRRGARNHAWREDVASAARPFSGSSLRSGGTGFAPCGSGLRHAAWPNGPCALRRGPGLLAACAPPPSRPRSSPPSYTRRASPSETRHAVPVPMHLATCAPHPSRQPRAPTASRKQAEQHKQLNAGIKIGSPNGDPIEELFGFAQRLPDALQSLHQANELALSYLDHSTRQRLGGYVIGLSGNSFTVDLYAALVDHATSIAR